MPSVFKGTINGEVLSQEYVLPFRIVSTKIANLNAGSTTLNLSITDGITDIYLAPNNLVLSQGDMLQDYASEVMSAGNKIKISTSANVSYFLTIENVEPD